MEVRVEPRTQSGQTLHEFDLGIGPHAQPSRHEDWLGNAMHWFSITDYHDRVEVACRSLVETSEAVLDPINIELPVVDCVSTLREWDFLQFGGPVIRSERLETLAQHLSLAECVTVGDLLGRLSESLGQHLLYQSFVTNAMSTSEDALEAGAGVCQDFAHVSLGLLRLCGVPCRYVNGYLHIDHPVKPSESHAWIEVWTPDHGWVGFDPTHSCSVGERHIVVAYGRHYNDVPPNRGIFRGASQETISAEVRTAVVERRERHHKPAPLIMDVPVFAESPDQQVACEHRADQAASQQQQ